MTTYTRKKCRQVVRGTQAKIEANAQALAAKSGKPVTVRWRDNPTELGVIFFPATVTGKIPGSPS